MGHYLFFFSAWLWRLISTLVALAKLLVKREERVGWQREERQRENMASTSSSGVATVSNVDLEPVKAFLQNALNAKLQGNSGPYNVIVQQFRVKDDQETLWRVILALNSFTSLLTQK